MGRRRREGAYSTRAENACQVSASAIMWRRRKLRANVRLCDLEAFDVEVELERFQLRQQRGKVKGRGRGQRTSRAKDGENVSLNHFSVRSQTPRAINNTLHVTFNLLPLPSLEGWGRRRRRHEGCGGPEMMMRGRVGGGRVKEGFAGTGTSDSDLLESM